MRHIGIASPFSEERRRLLLDEIRPYVTELAGHPGERGFLLGGGTTGKLLDDYRLRHPARFRRWRPDLHPAACTLDQLDSPPAALLPL